MSNTNAPFGFRWFSLGPGGGATNLAFQYRKISSADTTAIYRGDPVQAKATGYIGQGAASVVVSQHVGIFWGCNYLSNALGRRVRSTYWPGSDAADDPVAEIIPLAGATPQHFLVQATLTNFTFADIGANCDIDIGSGSVTGGYGKSGATLDQATLGTTSTLPFRIVDLYSSMAPKNANGIDDASNYNIVVVRGNSLQETGI